MGRPIKFRAWTGQAMIDNWMVTMGGQVMGCPYLGMTSPLYEVDVPLMQYTGLKDKNGREVFEGDIVRCIKDATPFDIDPYVVQYHAPVFWLGRPDKSGTSFYPVENYEVIGDIYTTPELLGDAS